MSTILFTIEGKAPQQPTASENEGLFIDEGILKLNAKAKADTAFFAFEYETVKVPLAYQHGATKTFLWNLAKGLPKLVAVDDGQYEPNFQITIYPGQSVTLFHEKAEVFFPANALFDTLYFTMRTAEQSLFLGKRTTPLFRPIQVLWTPKFPLSEKEKLAVFTLNRRGKPSFVGGEWVGRSIRFSTNTLGEFFLATEDDKPQVRLISRNTKQLIFRIADKTSGIKEYHAELNGKFLLMRYDYKKDLLWADLGKVHKAIQGDFKLTVTDEHGNKTIYARTF